MKKILAITLTLLMAFSVVAFSVSAADTDVAAIGETTYATLADAINACSTGDNTITLLNDSAETVTIKQQAGINIVIDGNGKKYTGTIKVDGNNRPDGAETLTIKNVNFENAVTGKYSYFINAEKNAKGGNSEAHNLTVDSCTFKGTNWQYAIATRTPYNLVVKNCTAEKVFYLLYNPQGGDKITVENCTVNSSNYGIGSQKCKETYIKNFTFNGYYHGIYGRASINGSTLTMENVNITSSHLFSIALWKNNDGGTSKTFTFVFKGENKVTGPEGMTWFAREDETNSPYEIAPKCYANVDSKNLEVVHTPGAAATCQAAQICTVCEVELDAIKEHELGEYVSDDNITCTTDGTKTAECIYGCGLKDTVVLEGTATGHLDLDGNGHCYSCDGEICDSCGDVHKDMISSFICLLADLIKLIVSFFSSICK